MDIEKEFEYDIAMNEEGYTKKEPETYKEVVLRGIEKCRVEMSKEMSKGKTMFIDRDGVSVPVVIPDQRKVVENCIKQLYDLLLWFFDDIATEKLEKLEEEINNLDEKYVDLYIKQEVHIPSMENAKQNRIINAESPLGNLLIQKKEDERVELFRKMYQNLILLYKRKNDLSNRKTASTY